jgi:predicted NAD/FAD-dependent oxidoreductase
LRLKEPHLQHAVNDVRESVDLLVLGAGMCGLTIAQELVNAGKKSWLIIDKGRSVGGRMATRRVNGQKFDHGAQFFTARSPLFKQLVEIWLRDGIVKEWTKGFNHHFHAHAHLPDDGHPRYAGVGGMNQIAKHLASKLPDDRVLLNEKIIEISVAQDTLLLKCEGGREIHAKTLVITSPIPQTLDLLNSLGNAEGLDAVRQELTKINYDPCVAFMGFFDADEFPVDALPIQSHDAVISFLADNYSKGLTSEKGSLTVHLAAEASRGMFTAHDQVIVGFICHQLKQLFGLKKLSTPKTYDIQRWRYATPQTTLTSPYLEWSYRGLSGPRILFAGEAFGGAKIEGAFLSAQSAAQRSLGQI